jgi:eukaryotic-like serine/threonine-protein kinase
MHAVTGTGRLIAGRYRLQGPVGRGAMGIVWRGRDELLHRDVAVKQVQLTALTLPAEAELAYQRTLREARTAARLSHPAVVTVFDVVEEDGSPWIIMEFIGGRSLEQVIAEDGPLPPLYAAELGARLLGALETAHAAGVLHRDVKPSNVLIGTDGRAVLTDFGIATFAEDPGITQVGMVVGTPGFTAPERVRGGGATPASDLWSLGATLYAAVEGRGPFERPGGSMAIIAGVDREEAPRAPSAGPLAPIIDALLSRDPAQRPDASAIGDRLAAVTAGTATRPVPSPPPSVSPVEPAASPSGTGQTFLDPPDFARLRMPGPDDLGDGIGALAAGTAAQPEDGLPEFMDSPSDTPASDAPSPQPGGSRSFWARHWRIVTAGGAFAAIVVAAVIGLGVYSGSLAADSPAPDNQAGAPGPAHNVTVSVTPRAGTRSRPAAGGTPGSSGQGGGADPSHSAQPSPSASVHPSTSPTQPAHHSKSPSPGNSLGPAPAGYQWQTVKAATLGTSAGFAIAVPDGWQTQVTGKTAYFYQSGGHGRVSVSLHPWVYAGPMHEARDLQQVAKGDDPGYRYGAVRPTELMGVTAAVSRFSWQPAGRAHRTMVLSELVTLATANGVQPYQLSVSAGVPYAAADRVIYQKMLSTFQPVTS